MVFAVGVNAHGGGGQLREQRVEMIDAEVDHHLLIAFAEVFRVDGEVSEDGHSCGFGTVECERTTILGGNPEMLGVPTGERLRVAGLQEDATDAYCFGHEDSS
jgi:hypothetical protein